MEPRRWPTFWEWVGYYFKLLLTHAPDKKTACNAAKISEEKLNHDMEKTGVPFIVPFRRFFGMKAMPEFVARFIDEVEKFYASSTPPLSPPSITPRPPRIEPATSV